MSIYNNVVRRLTELCDEKDHNQNSLANASAVPQATVKSIFNGESTNPGIVTIKKLCDGLEISITDFFDTEYFRDLEQEIE